MKRKGISTASRKAKGRKLQQTVRDKILECLPELEPDDCRSTGMGQNGEDLQLSPAARKLFPYSVECKSLARFAGYNYYDQAKVNSPTYAEPIAVVKANNRKPLVLVDAEYFIELVTKGKT